MQLNTTCNLWTPSVKKTKQTQTKNKTQKTSIDSLLLLLCTPITQAQELQNILHGERRKLAT